METSDEAQELAEPFERPDTFGRPPLWFADTQKGILLALVVLVVVALAGVWAWWRSMFGETPAGKAEVQVISVQLDPSDSDGGAAAPADPAVASFMANVPQMSADANISAVKNVAPVGAAEIKRPEKVDTAAVERRQQQARQSTRQAASVAVSRLERMLKEGRLRKMGLRGMGGIFKIPDDVDSVVYVIDKSGSMSGRPLQLVKAELISAIEGLTEDKKFYVMFYDNQTWPMYSSGSVSMTGQTGGIKLVAATATNKTAAIEWIEGVPSGGGTDPTPAMMAAIDQNPGLIYLLSDGAFSPNASQAIVKANNSRRDGKKIHCVGLSEAPIPTLIEIADKSGGVYYAVTR